MKTASEWASEYKDAICWANEEGQCRCEGACNLLLKFARAIQADAIRAAAGVCVVKREDYVANHKEGGDVWDISSRACDVCESNILSLIQD